MYSLVCTKDKDGTGALETEVTVAGELLNVGSAN